MANTGIYGLRKWERMMGETGTGVADSLASVGDSKTDTITFLAQPTFTSPMTMTMTDESEPLVMTNTITTPSTDGCRALFHVTTNVQLGGWANGVKGYMEFSGTSGKLAGLASGVCAELKMPNTTLNMGIYYPLEIEYVASSSTVTSGDPDTTISGGAGFIYLRSSGDTDGDFDDNGFFFLATGLLPGSSHLLSAQAITLRVGVGVYGSEVTKYLVMSSTENNLTLATTAGTSINVGTCTNGIVFGTVTWEITMANDVVIFENGGTPSSGSSGTGAAITGAGSLCLDSTNKRLYLNIGTKASPDWKYAAFDT